MKMLSYALFALLFFATTALAAPASESSIKELLAVTQVRKLAETIRGQFDSAVDNASQNALQGRTPTPKQKQAIDNLKKRTVAIMQGELAWEKLELVYLRLYRESFSEEEVAGMLSFYKTPAGQAVIHKMPTLMQQTMLEVQNMVTGLTPQLQKVREQFVAEMTAANQ